MAAQIPLSYINKPMVIIAIKNVLDSRDNISVEDVKNNCCVIKILNRNNL